MKTEIIKGCTPDQIDRLYELEKACFTRSFRWNKSDFIASINENSIWIALYKNEIIGYLLIKIREDASHILSLGVNPNYQNRGVATALIKEAEQYCKMNKIKKLKLEVHVDNPAQVLYFRLGYRVSMFRSNYYYNGANAMVMTKLL